MNKRIFVEKSSTTLRLRRLLRTQTQSSINEFDRFAYYSVYDVFGLADSLFERAEKHIFSEQVTDTILAESDVVLNLLTFLLPSNHFQVNLISVRLHHKYSFLAAVMM